MENQHVLNGLIMFEQRFGEEFKDRSVLNILYTMNLNYDRKKSLNGHYYMLQEAGPELSPISQMLADPHQEINDCLLWYPHIPYSFYLQASHFNIRSKKMQLYRGLLVSYRANAEGENPTAAQFLEGYVVDLTLAIVTSDTAIKPIARVIPTVSVVPRNK